MKTEKEIRDQLKTEVEYYINHEQYMEFGNERELSGFIKGLEYVLEIG